MGHLQADDTVLVHAAGSGVGTSAVQLARLAGATVIAVAGDDAKLAAVAGLGAQHTINYKCAVTDAAVSGSPPPFRMLPRPCPSTASAGHTPSSQGVSRR